MDKLKLLLGIDAADTSKDGLLELMLAEAEDFVLSYCFINAVPSGLQGLLPFMAADLYRAAEYGAETLPSDVKSVTEGDRSVSYEVNRLNVSEVLEPYLRRLRPYRKMRTPSSEV